MPQEGRTARVREQRALCPYPVVVAGVEGPICLQPLATGNPIAGLSMKKAGGACTPLPVAAQCAGVGALHSPQALRVLGVDVHVDAVRAAAALRAHHGQPVAWGREGDISKGTWAAGSGQHCSTQVVEGKGILCSSERESLTK